MKVTLEQIDLRKQPSGNIACANPQRLPRLNFLYSLQSWETKAAGSKQLPYQLAPQALELGVIVHLPATRTAIFVPRLRVSIPPKPFTSRQVLRATTERFGDN